MKSAVHFALRLLGVFALSSLFLYLACLNIYLPLMRMSVALFSVMGCVCLLWGLFRSYSLIFWIPVLFLGGAQVATYHLFGAYISHPLVLAEIFEGSKEEILAYLTFRNVALVMLLLSIVIGLGLLMRWCMKPMNRIWLIVLGLVFCTVVACKYFGPRSKERTLISMWPVSDIRSLYLNTQDARAYNEKMKGAIQSLPSPADKPSSSPLLKPDSSVVVVLHVGESVRADRLSLNGYLNQGRSTTPWLDSQKGSSLINFSNCISSHLWSSYSVMTILTNARRAGLPNVKGLNELVGGANLDVAPDMCATSGSLLDLFDANQFSVYSFMGNLAGLELRHEKLQRMLTSRRKDGFYAPGKPHTSIPQITNVLGKTGQNNLFFYINNEGSHVPFGNYDEDSAPFQPSLPNLNSSASQAQAVNNAYDNTIHYTDEFIRRVVEQLKGRPFIYVYVSDHGEYLGHDGMWGRGGAVDCYHSTSGCRVGMFIITSPEYEALHPHFAEAVKNLRAHADMTVGHEHIYHTLLGIVGIETPYYNAALDLSSANPEPYTGPQPEKK